MYVSKGTTVSYLLEELKEHSQVQLNMAYDAEPTYAEELVEQLQERNKHRNGLPLDIHCTIKNFEGYSYPSYIFSIVIPDSNRKAKFLLSDILE